jgi:hypothetical protein
VKIGIRRCVVEKKTVLLGFGIVVCDRGFVYVGRLTWDGEFALVEDAKNIRYWGTTNGLGELALNGPTSKTKLDQVGTVRIPCRAVINIIDTEASKWPSSK